MLLSAVQCFPQARRPLLPSLRIRLTPGLRLRAGDEQNSKGPLLQALYSQSPFRSSLSAPAAAGPVSWSASLTPPRLASQNKATSGHLGMLKAKLAKLRVRLARAVVARLLAAHLLRPARGPGPEDGGRWRQGRGVRRDQVRRLQSGARGCAAARREGGGAWLAFSPRRLVQAFPRWASPRC